MRASALARGHDRSGRHPTARSVAPGRRPPVCGIPALDGCSGAGIVRRKAQIGAIDDALEHEADRIGHRIMLGGSAGDLGTAGPTTAPGAIVQRKCTACAEEEKIQRKADDAGTGSQGSADHPDPVAAVAAGGVPLPASARAFFEPRFDRDLSAVRVHTGAKAAAAARAIHARAYTLGQDIAFGAGQYVPQSPAGRRLLAHELVHVVQQDGRAMARPQAQPAAGASGDAFEREADRIADTVIAGGSARPSLRTGLALQRDEDPSLFRMPRLRLPDVPPPPLFAPGSIREHWVIPMPRPAAPVELEPPMLSPLPFWQRRRPLGGDLSLGPITNWTPVIILREPRCVPDRSLTWADFPGSSVPGGFGGVTRVGTPQIVVDGNPMFQAQLRATSAVVAASRNPGNRPTNGCAPAVSRCRAYLNAHPGHTWSSAKPIPDPCPAGILTPATATTPDECETVVGVGCDADAAGDSARLLAHEQVHFDIACALVGKANDALIAGTHTPAVLATWLAANHQPQQDLYDSVAQSNHGCNAAGQATWVAAVGAGLPAVPLPAPVPTPVPAATP